jgi:hypothetical protein
MGMTNIQTSVNQGSAYQQNLGKFVDMPGFSTVVSKHNSIPVNSMGSVNKSFMSGQSPAEMTDFSSNRKHTS